MVVGLEQAKDSTELTRQHHVKQEVHETNGTKTKLITRQIS